MPGTVDVDRRVSLRLLVAGLVSVPLARLPAAAAADEVSEDDELARQLGYVTDAARADTARFPKRAEPGGEDQFCRSCQFYKGDGASETGGCVVFGGRMVKAAGWCNSWFAKAD